MHLATEKNLNKYAYPVFPRKGREIQHPHTASYGANRFVCAQGHMKPQNWMILDVLATLMIQQMYRRSGEPIDFSRKIPTMKYPRAYKASQEGLSKDVLNLLIDASRKSKDGLIDMDHYKSLPSIAYESNNFRLRDIITLMVSDSKIKKYLPFLKNYSSAKFHDIIQDTANCKVEMKYPIRYYYKDKYCNIDFNNYGNPCSFFTLVKTDILKTSSDGHVLERGHIVKFDTYLGYFLIQNAAASLYVDLLPDRFYNLSDYAQLFYRLLILPYFKGVKNPVRMEEISQRLDLKTRDISMLRKIIKRVLDELEAESFIRNPREITEYGPYMYGYEKSSWKELNK